MEVSDALRRSGPSIDPRRQRSSHVHASAFVPGAATVIVADLGTDHLVVAQLVHRAVERGAGYRIYNAVSANSAGGWDITDACRDFGYQSLDDAEDHPASRSPPPHPAPPARTCTVALPGVGP